MSCLGDPFSIQSIVKWVDVLATVISSLNYASVTRGVSRLAFELSNFFAHSELP